MNKTNVENIYSEKAALDCMQEEISNVPYNSYIEEK